MAQLATDQEAQAERAEAEKALRNKVKEYQNKKKQFVATGAGVMPDEEYQRRKVEVKK